MSKDHVKSSFRGGLASAPITPPQGSDEVFPAFCAERLALFSSVRLCKFQSLVAGGLRRFLYPIIDVFVAFVFFPDAKGIPFGGFPHRWVIFPCIVRPGFLELQGDSPAHETDAVDGVYESFYFLVEDVSCFELNHQVFLPLQLPCRLLDSSPGGPSRERNRSDL